MGRRTSAGSQEYLPGIFGYGFIYLDVFYFYNSFIKGPHVGTTTVTVGVEPEQVLNPIHRVGGVLNKSAELY